MKRLAGNKAKRDHSTLTVLQQVSSLRRDQFLILYKSIQKPLHKKFRIRGKEKKVDKNQTKKRAE